MPELPEVEAWVRELDPLVSAQPIERAGPAHVATLKTIDPPLSALEGRRLEGAERRAKNLLFPTEDGELVLRIHLMSAGRIRYLEPGAKGPKTPMFRLRFQGGGELLLTEGGRKKRAGVWLTTPEQVDPISRTWGRTRSRSTPPRSRRSSGATVGSSTRSCATSARSPGIGRAHANEILLRARLSPFKASTELTPEEIERLASTIHENLSRGARAAPAREGRQATSMSSTTASASRARSAGAPSCASTSRSTRSTTARSARPAAGC